jgi:Na+/melibiose symporter-like transporter
LGGDATILPSILADVIRKRERSGGLEFGIWNFISKFTLALAAGIALPALYYLGYSPNAANAQGLGALSLAYALLPCVFKCAALILLVLSPIDKPRRAL